MCEIAFHLGSLPVHWYGIFVAAGFLSGIWTATRRAQRVGLPPENIADIGVWLLVGAMLGAKALYLATYWRKEFTDESLLQMVFTRTGFVFYGGLIGATCAGVFFTWWKKLPVWKTADVLAPSIALGHAFGRIGCLMTGCCFGRVTTVPWAIHFPEQHPTHGQGVHPTQIYESLLNFALCAALAWLFRRKKFDGQVFAAYLMGYAVLRSVVEMFRGDYEAALLTGRATPAHWISVVSFVLGLTLFILRRRATPAAPQPQP